MIKERIRNKLMEEEKLDQEKKMLLRHILLIFENDRLKFFGK